jgi:hypothetical protein
MNLWPGKMNKIEILINEVAQFPEDMIDDILLFIQFIKERAIVKKLETLILSEKTLSKDWLRPEEDEAWQDL